MSTVFEDVRLDRLFTEVKDTVPASSVKLLSPSTVYGVVPQTDLESRPQQAFREGYRLLPAKVGDFVISMSSFRHGLEYCGISGGISPDYTLLRPIVCPEVVQFLRYSLKSPFLVEQLALFRTGIRQGQRLQWNKVRYLRIPIPKNGYAKSIVPFIERECGRMDKLVKKKQEFIVLLKEKRQALITHAVTKGLDPNVEMKDSGVEWLGEVPKHWDLPKLGYICHVDTGSKDTQDALKEGDYPFYVRSQTPERINSYSYDCEAILTAGDGAGVGKVFHLVKGKFEAHQRVYVLHSFERLLAEFAFYYIKELFKQVALTGDAKSTVDSVRRFMLTMLPITVPPDREQLEIIEHIKQQTTRIDQLISKTQESIDLLKERKTSLITAAVTGQIDVS